MAGNDVRIRTQVTGAKQATGEVRGLRDAFDRLQKQGAKGLGIGVGFSAATMALGAVQSAIGGVTDFIGESIQAASDLSESMSKSSVVFGENAAEVERWASRGAEAFGLSKQAALEAASTYGNLFQAFGEGAERSQIMSQRLVELAADLASFNNTSIEDALQALRSGLSGETEPLKRYGIAINDARMRQALMAKGVKDLGATLTPLQKAQAAYTLILQDSSLAQGDFARTSEGLANQVRIQQAELDNLRASVGDDLIPLQLSWEKGNLDLIRSTRLLTDVLHAGEIPRGQLREDMQALINTVPIVGGVIGGLTEDLADQAQAAEDDERALDGTTVSVDDLSGVADAAAPSVEDLAQALEDTERAARDAEGAVDDYADVVSDELFGDAINAGNLAKLREAREELERQKPKIGDGARAWRIWKGEVAEAEQRLFDLQLQMKEREGPRAVIRWLEQQKDKFGDTTGQIQALINKYRTLLGLQSKLAGAPLAGGIAYTGANPGARASGGPVSANKPYIVGEDGPELMVPSTSGTIIPNDAMGGSAWGGSMTLNLNVVGATLTPAISAQFAREAGPAIADYLQRRGLIRR